jgi:hypothetical protein
LFALAHTPPLRIPPARQGDAYASPFFFDARHHPRRFCAGTAFILVSHALCRGGAIFSADFLDFSPAFFLKSGVICPPARQRLPGRGKFCRVAGATGQIPPDTFFLPGGKSMFNRKLLAVGMTLANRGSGKTPKEHCSRPERRDQNVL